jgi:hypothetical protein
MTDLTLTPKKAKGKLRPNRGKKLPEKVDQQNQFVQILDKSPEVALTFGKWLGFLLILYTLAAARSGKMIFKLGAFGAVGTLIVASLYGIWKHWN